MTTDEAEEILKRRYPLAEGGYEGEAARLILSALAAEKERADAAQADAAALREAPGWTPRREGPMPETPRDELRRRIRLLKVDIAQAEDDMDLEEADALEDDLVEACRQLRRLAAAGAAQGEKPKQEPSTCGFCSYEESDGSLIEQCEACRRKGAAGEGG